MTADRARLPAILVVEDDPAVLQVLGAILEHHGFRALRASRGEQAVELYRQQAAAIDLVLLDVQLPECDGVQTLARLRALDPDVGVVFLTGYTGKYSVQELLDLGAAQVVAKPPDLEQLKDLLWSLVRARRSKGPAGASAAGAGNRRGAVRRQPPLGTVCRLDAGAGQPEHLGLVWNLSTNGVSLLLHAPLAAATVFPAELKPARAPGSLPVVLQVVHMSPLGTGDYMLGAQFQKPLAKEELHPFLAEAPTA